MKTKLLSLLCLTLFIGSISAQTFEGKLTFGIDYELPEAMEAQRSMLPSEMIIYITKGHVRIEQKTMMGDQNVITDTKAKKTVLLMNMMGKKMAITMTDDGKEKPTPKIIYSNETKTIGSVDSLIICHFISHFFEKSSKKFSMTISKNDIYGFAKIIPFL